MSKQEQEGPERLKGHAEGKGRGVAGGSVRGPARGTAKGIVRPDFSRSPERKLDMSDMFADSVATDFDIQAARKIALDSLLDNPYQPRFEMREEGLEDLSHVIASQGFQGVLVARPHPSEPAYYQLTAGHRRREAARRAGLDALPVVVRELSDEEMVALTITENIQREDLSPLEEGKIYLLMSEKMGYTHEQIAREIGKKRGYVENRIRVARAPDDVQRMVQARPDTLVIAYYLGKLEDERARAGIIEGVLAGRLASSDVPHYIEVLKSEEVARAVAVDATGGNASQFAAEAGAVGAGQKDAAYAHDGLADTLGLEQRSVHATATPASELHTGWQPGSMRYNRQQVDAKAVASPGRPSGTAGDGVSGTPARGAAAHEIDRGVRVRRAKLSAAVSALRAYREHASEIEAISEEERQNLSEAWAMVEELRLRFAIDG